MTSEYAHIRIPGQDDDGIDFEGLRRQQIEDHAVGVTAEMAHAEHPNAFEARYHVVGSPRNRSVGSTQKGEEVVIPIYALARVDLVTGHNLNTMDSATLATRVIPDEFHAGDLPEQRLADALTTEDLAEAARGRAINQVRKGLTTRIVHTIR
jgi:hypothetical protein